MARVEKAAGPAATAGRSKASGSAKGPSRAAPAASVKGAPRATATLAGSGAKRVRPADGKPANAKAADAGPKPVAAAGKRPADRAVIAAAATRAAPKPAPKPAAKAASRAEPKAQPKPKVEAKPAPRPAPKVDAKPKASPPGARTTGKAGGAKTTAAAKVADKPAARTGPARVDDGARPSAAPAKKAPVRARSEPLDKFLAEQRQLLLEERATHLVQAASLKEEADALAAEMEPGESEFGEEGGEGGNLSIERELDLVLSAQAKAAVEEIERALAKIEAGTYGLCEKCGREIPKARLRVLPHAPLCVACKSGGLSRR
jgi:DnaK suppressor protein